MDATMFADAADPSEEMLTATVNEFVKHEVVTLVVATGDRHWHHDQRRGVRPGRHACVRAVAVTVTVTVPVVEWLTVAE